jgi:outer membrane biosynthesis protein TonB
MRSTLGLVVLLAAGLGAAACATGRAQIPEQPPTLVVPPVPPRAIEPPAVVEPPVEPPPVEPAPTPPPSTTKQGKPRAAIEAKPDPKQDPPPDVVATVPTPPPVAPLRTPTTPTGAEAVRQIKEILESTQKLLDKVDEPQLSADRKANLTSARAFIQQADEALKKEELTLARSLAERAQNIAKLLTSR